MFCKRVSSVVRNLSAVAAVFALASAAHAVTLSSANTSVTFNPSVGKMGPFPPYISSWTVNGIEQFIGSSSGGENFIIGFNGGGGASLSEFPLTSSSSPDSQQFVANYIEDGFSIIYSASIIVGPPGSENSRITSTIQFKNTGTTSFQVGLTDNLEYSVGGDTKNNVLNLSPAGTPNPATQTSGPTTIKFTANNTPDLFFTSSDGGKTVSDTNTGPITGQPQFTFGWKNNLNPGDSTTISFDETLSGSTPSGPGGPPSVPLPSAATASLATLAGLGIFGIFRRNWTARA
jgi:hypothetical protein